MVALPTLPKFDDKLERGRWCSEYDKVEGDLLRNHLGSDTVTLGLRTATQGPSVNEFDRRLPSMDEPTEADKLEAIRAASRKPRAASSMAVMATTNGHHTRASTSDAICRGGAHSALGFRDDMSSVGGISPVRHHRALSPSLSVTRCMTALDSSYGGATSMNGTVNNNNTTASSSVGGDPLKSTTKCVKLLDTLLHPPASYKNSFHLNLSGVDLEWMWHYAADRAPPQLLTLETLRDDAHGASTSSASGVHGTVINSPRSVMVMLRNGVSVVDLIRRPTSYFERADITLDAADAASQHYEERRRAMLSSLREDYRDVCASVPLHEVVRGLQNKHKQHISEEKARASPVRKRRGLPGSPKAARHDDGGAQDDSEESGFAAQRRMKMERLAEKSREKMRKQLEALEALKKEIAEGEARQKANEKALHERDADRRRIVEQRSASAAKQFAEMRAKANLYNVSHIAEMEKRRLKLEAKAAAKLEAIQARADQQRQESEAKVAAKALRLQQNRSAIETLKAEEAQKQAEKEQRAAEKRAQLAQRRAAERDEAIEQQKKIADQRHEAQERVRMQRDAFLEKAAAREREVRERLECFQENQKQSRQAAHELEMAKEKRRLQTISAAESIVRSKTETIVEKRNEHMRALEMSLQQRAEEQKRAQLETMNVLEDKRFLVGRQSNSSEFKKLLRAVQMIDKEEQSRHIAEQKARMLEIAAVEREQLRLQKEAAAAKIAKIA